MIRFRNKGDCIGHNISYAIAQDNSNIIQDIYDELYFENTLWRSPYHKENKINTMSRDHILWLKVGCLYFKSNIFNDYFKSLKPNKRISEKEKSKLTYDLWLFINDYHFLWQLFVRIWYAGLIYHWNKLLRKVFSIKVKPWIQHNPDKYDNWLQAWICVKQKRDKFQVFLPGFVHNQICFALWSSKNYWLLTKSIKKRLMKLTWNGNPQSELLLTGFTKIENIEFIKFTNDSLCQKMPCQYSDAKYSVGNEINYTYFVCLRLYDNMIGLPYHLKIELDEF